MSGFHHYLAELLCPTLTSTSTATTAEEFNPSCIPATRFRKDHGSNNKAFPVPFNSLIVFVGSYSDTGNTNYASNNTVFQPMGDRGKGDMSMVRYGSIILPGTLDYPH